MKFKNSFMSRTVSRTLTGAQLEAGNANDSRDPEVTSCPPSRGETARLGKIGKSRRLHKQNTRLETAAIMVSARGVLGRSIIGAIDQVLILPNDLIGLTLPRFAKRVHETRSEGREATSDMTKNGHQRRARETGAVFIGVGECLRRHFSLHQHL